MNKTGLLEIIIRAEYENAVGRLHFCSYAVGYVGDTDDQVEVALNPPALVIVEDDESGLDHYNDTHLDPYWSIRLAQPDSRLNNLRSMWTYGPSYCLDTGKLEGSKTIWLAPYPWYQPWYQAVKLFFQPLISLFAKG